jgi:arylsulfatase
MERDRTELEDLASKYPGKVSELAAKWEAWAERCGIEPWPVRRQGASARKSRSGS